MPARLIPVSLAGAALIALLIYGLSAHSSNRTLDELVAKGEHPPVPQATRRLPILQGHGTNSVSAYRGKVVLMNIWASWCIPCQEEAPELQKTQQELARHNATVLGVTYEDAAPDSIKFIHSNRLSYPDLRDDNGEFARLRDGRGPGELSHQPLRADRSDRTQRAAERLPGQGDQARWKRTASRVIGKPSLAARCAGSPSPHVSLSTTAAIAHATDSPVVT